MKQLFNLDDNGRNGEPRSERPSQVDSLIDETEVLGFNEGAPLANVPYPDYPQSREQLDLPYATGVLKSIAESDCVRDQRDLAMELGLNGGSTIVESACAFHNIDLPKEADYTPSPIVESPDGEGGTIRFDKNDFPTFQICYHLYLTLGLGVSEIATVLDTEETAVRSGLSEHGFL